MVGLSSLVLPILISAVVVFVASSIIHMVLPYHKSDMRRIPGGKEDDVLETLRRITLPPGDYGAPHPGSMAGMTDPAFVAKMAKGPQVLMTIAPGGSASMGKSLLLGLELNYLVAKNKIGTGFACRYSYSNNEKFYAQYSALANAYVLGSSFKFGEATNVAVELELGGMQNVSNASIGYRRKTKTYQVNSAFKTDGEVKSLFTLNNQNAYKLKLSLGGNLWKEDFRAGYSFSFGQTED